MKDKQPMPTNGEMVTPEMIEAGRVAYFHYRHTVEGDVRFNDLTEEEQVELASRIYIAMHNARTPPTNGASSETLVERLRDRAACAEDALNGDGDNNPVYRAAIALDREAADEIERLTALTEQRAADEVERIARRLVNQRDEPWPGGSDSDRLHYWRDKAIKAANELRSLANPSSEDNQ